MFYVCTINSKKQKKKRTCNLYVVRNNIAWEASGCIVRLKEWIHKNFCDCKVTVVIYFLTKYNVISDCNLNSRWDLKIDSVLGLRNYSKKLKKSLSCILCIGLKTSLSLYFKLFSNFPVVFLPKPCTASASSDDRNWSTLNKFVVKISIVILHIEV